MKFEPDCFKLLVRKLGILIPKSIIDSAVDLGVKLLIIKMEMNGELEVSVFSLCCLEKTNQGAQWLSGRVLDSRPRGRGFDPHRHHCVVVLEQDTFILA